jgi:hypothetical protein
MRLGWVFVCGAACGGSAAAPAKRVDVDTVAIDAGVEARPRPVIAAKRVDVPESCHDVLSDLYERVQGRFLYAPSARDTVGAVIELRRVPAECRGAQWYLAAAHLLRRRPKPLEIGDGVELSDPAQALELALAAGDSVQVLAFVAMVSSVGGAPARPADACERAHGDWYVCAHAALRAGDPARALEALGRRKTLAHLPDQELLAARALMALGRADEAVTAISRRVNGHEAVGFGLTHREFKLLEAEADHIRDRH